MTNSKLKLEELAFERVEIYPNRPTIIFLHDSLGCIDLWREFPKKLGGLTKCNIIVYDRQGYGRSTPFISKERGIDYLEIEAYILNDLMMYWGIETAILFGHSDGGSIALLAASLFPNKIKGVIAEGAHVFVEDKTIKGIRDAVELYKTTELKERLTKYHGGKTEAMFMAWTETWLRKDFRDWNIESYLKKIACPVLVIQGEKDEYGTLKQVQSIVENTNGNSKKLIVPIIGHTPHKEAPKFILEKTAAFISQL